MSFKNFIKNHQKKEVIHYPGFNEQRVLLSVCVQTYQHGNYIKECLDGILMQKTDFQFEILLGDDESADGTREICTEYAEKYPDKIRLFLHHRENNIKVNGNPTGRFNFLYNLYNARGKYIALCEGDDYWTDPLKLQKQVDFLEKNLDYEICFHKVQILEKNDLIKDYIEERYNKIKNFPIGIIDLLEQGNFIHTPSVVFRNPNVNFPFEFTLTSVGDYFLYIILTKNGFIKRLDDTMAVYRKGVGIYSTLSDKEMKNKILNYQICILSYLEDPKQKEIILQKVLKSIDELKKESSLDNKTSSLKLSMKSKIKLFLTKFNQKFK